MQCFFLFERFIEWILLVIATRLFWKIFLSFASFQLLSDSVVSFGAWVSPTNFRWKGLVCPTGFFRVQKAGSLGGIYTAYSILIWMNESNVRKPKQVQQPPKYIDTFCFPPQFRTTPPLLVLKMVLVLMSLWKKTSNKTVDILVGNSWSATTKAKRFFEIFRMLFVGAETKTLELVWNSEFSPSWGPKKQFLQ